MARRCGVEAMNELLMSVSGLNNIIPDQYIAVGGYNKILFYTLDGIQFGEVELYTERPNSVCSMVFSEGYLFAVCGGRDLYIINKNLKIISKKDLGLSAGGGGSLSGARIPVGIGSNKKYYPILTAGNRIIRADLPGSRDFSLHISEAQISTVHEVTYIDNGCVNAGLYTTFIGGFASCKNFGLNDPVGSDYPRLAGYKNNYLTAPVTGSSKSDFCRNVIFFGVRYSLRDCCYTPRAADPSMGSFDMNYSLSTKSSPSTALTLPAPSGDYYFRVFGGLIEERGFYKNIVMKPAKSLGISFGPNPGTQVRYSQSRDMKIICISEYNSGVSVFDAERYSVISVFKPNQTPYSIALNDGWFL